MIKTNKRKKILLVIDRYTFDIIKKVEVANSQIAISIPKIKDEDNNELKILNNECIINYKDADDNKRKELKVDTLYYTAIIVIIENNKVIEFSPLTDNNFILQMIDFLLIELEELKINIKEHDFTIILDKNKNLFFEKNNKIINEKKYNNYNYHTFLETFILPNKNAKIQVINEFFKLLNKKLAQA